MNNSLISNKQKIAYNTLINESLPGIVADSSIDTEKYSIQHRLHPINLCGPLKDKRNTLYSMLKTDINITDKTTGESMQVIVDLLKIPVYQDLGFLIGGNYKQILDRYVENPGVSFSKKEKKDGSLVDIATVMSSHNRKYHFEKGERSAYFYYGSTTKSIPINVLFKALTNMSDDDLLEHFGYNTLNIEVFREDNSMTNTLKRRKGVNGIDKNKSFLDKSACIELVYKALYSKNNKDVTVNKTATDMYNAIQNQFFNPRYFQFGPGFSQQLDKLQSYSNRAINKILAEDIELPDGVLREGSVLTEKLLQIIDSLPITSLKVNHQGAIYDLRKFSCFTFRALNKKLAEDVQLATEVVPQGTLLDLQTLELLNNSEVSTIKVYKDEKLSNETVPISRRVNATTLTIEDLFTIYSIFSDNVCGFDTYSKKYELTNRIIIPFDKAIENLVQQRLNYVNEKLEETLKMLHNSSFEQDTTELGEEIEASQYNLLSVIPDISIKDTELDEYIDSIRDQENSESQMSDMNNILSYYSKSFKATTSIPTEAVTPDMIAVQDLQGGRFDPFDAPESKKIGIVHHRTILSKLDDVGNIVVPYLQVKNGKVLSKEPVYLSASDEVGKYIAEWNETFVDENGEPKKRILAKHNGTISTVATELVTLKEYSQLQNMSPARACIPLQEHSAGKRLEMACNHGKQAVPTVKSQRARVGTGCEGILDIGTTNVSELLNIYYNNVSSINPEIQNYKQSILHSDVKLLNIISEPSYRILQFEVLEATRLNEQHDLGIDNTLNHKIPFMMRNSEAHIFTTRINVKPNNIYSYNDIVTYNSGYDMNEYPLDVIGNYGGLNVDQDTLKSGLGLGRDLIVAYKTYGSSTIDDSITISSDLVYDDDLTSITTYEIEEELKSSETRVEEFGAPNDPNFEYTGLPKIGVVLEPGDVVIYKRIEKTLDNTVQYKGVKLDAYTYGQVVSTNIVHKNNKVVAKVILATRSYIEVGDKLSGRYGNKGVIAKIQDASLMPYDPITGIKADIVLNPLGIPSRMNISQVLEVTLGMALYKEDVNKRAVIAPFSNEGFDYVREAAKSQNVHPVTLIDGRTGLPFKRPINLGIIHMFKLTHMSKKKINSIGFDHPINLSTLQARKGRKFKGGQSFSEMESWCLESIGAFNVLHEIQSTLADDQIGRQDVKKEILKNPFVISMGSERSTLTLGDNRNDATLKAYIRALGVDILTESSDDMKETYYSFVPMTDQSIRALSANPVRDVNSLHNPNIFGTSYNSVDVANSRDKWGYLELNTRIINPIWLHKGSLNEVIFKKENATYKSITKNDFTDIIQGNLFVKVKKHAYVLLCKPDDEILSKESDWLTGFDALYYIFEQIDLQESLNRVNAKIKRVKNADTSSELQSYDFINSNREGADPQYTVYQQEKEKRENNIDNKKLLSLVKQRKIIEDTIATGIPLTDYFITTYPVIPQIFRPVSDIPGQRAVADLDHYYTHVINAANAAKNNDTNSAKLAVYTAIENLLGITKQDKKDEKYKTLKGLFTGKEGAFRKKMQSKRISRSGRAVICPMEDTTMKPNEVGVPFSMLLNLYKEQLISMFLKLVISDEHIPSQSWDQLFITLNNKNKNKFKKLYSAQFFKHFGVPKEEAYDYFIKYITYFIEGSNGVELPEFKQVLEPQVVLVGRQPSLHKFAIRAYYPKIVYTNVLYVHPLVCKGYNADFDGDQEWVSACLSEESKKEAITKMTAKTDIINPKDSKIILELAQDIALGIYCATMLKDNKITTEFGINDIHYYNSISSIENDILCNVIQPWDLVCYSNNKDRFLSTAGRILFNSCIPDGFTYTDNEFNPIPFKNCLNITGIDTSKFRELRYDGLITSGNANYQDFSVFKLQDICKDIYYEKGEGPYEDSLEDSAVEYYQKLTEFGFLFSDLFGITLSLDDLDEISSKLDKDAILKDADNTRLMLEDDYQTGLISAEDKKDAITKLYNGVQKKVENKLMDSIPRNNNLFIMFDSGARGSKGQILQTCGIISILQKSQTDTIEMPITSNYYEGLSSFDVLLSSYSTRTAVSSTQNETGDAGYATRRAVYMESGLEIVEHDCHKEDWWFDVKWDHHLPEYDRLVPSKKYFDENLLGKIICDEETINLFGDTLMKDSNNNHIITEASFDKLSNGFKTMTLFSTENASHLTKDISKSDFERKFVGALVLNSAAREELQGKGLCKDGVLNTECYDILHDIKSDIYCSTPNVITISLNSLYKVELTDTNPIVIQSLKNLLQNNKITNGAIKVIESRAFKQIVTENGTYHFRYAMLDAHHSLLLGREARNLEGLESVYTQGETIQVISEDTIRYIELAGLDRIEARILLDCNSGGKKSPYGLCAHCYGLKYGDHTLPKVGEFVGFEAAQAIGEPSAQLTMNLVHAGGAVGASVASGVDIFSNLLNGSLPKTVPTAIVAQNNGYVSINKLDATATISVVPENTNNKMCQMCMHKEENHNECPLQNGDIGDCFYDKKINAQNIIVNEGQWVNASEALTAGYKLANDIKDVNGGLKELLREKQMTWLLNYFNTFRDNNITINARHFEILAYLQNFLLTVVESEDENFKVGNVYPANEILAAKDKVRVVMETNKLDDVILQNSGALTSLTFQDNSSVLANLVTKHVQSHNNSPIGRISVGENLVTGKKRFFIKNNTLSSVFTNEAEENDVEFVTDATAEATSNIDFSALQNLDFESLSLEPTNSDNEPETTSDTIPSITHHFCIKVRDMTTSEFIPNVSFSVKSDSSIQEVINTEECLLDNVQTGNYEIRLISIPEGYKFKEYCCNIEVTDEMDEYISLESIYLEREIEVDTEPLIDNLSIMDTFTEEEDKPTIEDENVINNKQEGEIESSNFNVRSLNLF